MKEDIAKKLQNVSSTLLLIQNDITNPEGSCMSEVIFDVLDQAIDTLKETMKMIG